jgi:signal transduction histidine kinase/PAS domain-containing protein
MYTDLTVVLVAGSAAGALLSAVLAVGAFRDRSVPGAVYFGWLMFSAVGWCLLNIAWLTTSSSAVAQTVFLLTRLTAGLVVGLWVVFAIVYTGRESWLTPARLAGLLLAPSVYAILALTNSFHGLVTAETLLVSAAGQTLFIGVTGTVYAVQNAVSVLLVAAGYALFGEFLLRSRNLYRKQTFVILTAGLLTAGAHGLFVLGATPHPGIDPTPLTFALNGLLIGVALFRYDFVSVTPLAGDLLVDELPDPVLVLDEDRVIDFNAAASELFDDDELGGRAVDDISPGLLAGIERESMVTLGDPIAYYDPQVRPITDQYGAVRGRLVVLRDVTGQHRRQERLETLQSATQQFLEADQPERVAELAVNFATRVLDKPGAAVFRYEDGRLEPTAVSDALTEFADAGTLTVDPESAPDHPLWQAYDDGERRLAQFGRGVDSLSTALLLPIGDHGVLVIGSGAGGYTSEEEQYAEILCHTTQVALEQVVRQRELRGSRASLERRNEQIEFFNGVLRHSLRNAMLVVQGRAEHLSGRVDEANQPHVESIVTWCSRLTEMSGTIRDINETVTASESERLEPVSLADVVCNAVDAASDGREGVRIETDVSGGEWIQANDLVKKVVTTIVENAVQHNTSDDPRVDIGTRDAGDWIQLRIADNGPGISDELKTTMFERSMSPDQTAGGFGLYFVSVMMDLYGGKVWYEDNDPTGTVAILEFQRAAVPDRDGPSADVTPVRSAGAETQGKSPDN